MVNLPRFYQNRSFLRLHKSTVFYKTVFLMDLLVLKGQRLLNYGFIKTVVFFRFHTSLRVFPKPWLLNSIKPLFLMDLLVLKRQRLIYYGFSKTVVFHGFVSYERTTVNQLRLYKNRGLNQINNGQNTTAL